MKKIILILDAIYNRCVDYLFYISEVLIGILMMVIVADVVIRYTLRGAILWGFEFTEYSLVYLTFLGTAWLLRKNLHVRIFKFYCFHNPHNLLRYACLVWGRSYSRQYPERHDVGKVLLNAKIYPYYYYSHKQHLAAYSVIETG
jgi:hypothetical protein